MQKLKERISQLDQENQSLMVHKKNDFDGDNDTNLDVQSLIERILRYIYWAQSFTSLKADLYQDLNGGLAFSR